MPTSEDDTRVFIIRRKLTSRAKAVLLEELARRLGGDVRSPQSFEVRAGSDRLNGKLEAKSLALQFSGRSARDRWMPLVRQFAGEHDLAESE